MTHAIAASFDAPALWAPTLVPHDRRLFANGLRIILRTFAVVIVIVGSCAVAACIVSAFLGANSDLRVNSPMQLEKKVALAGPHGALAYATETAGTPQVASLLFEPKVLALNVEPTIDPPRRPVAISVAPPAPEHPPKAASRVPLPPPRPLPAADAQPTREVARRQTPVVAAVAPAAASEPRAGRSQEVPVLASVDSRTAVYDISARTVYLPSGRRLEAHSGLGDKMDNPRYVSVKNRGPTPPNVYDLTLREQLFHGVRAIRLTPVSDGNMFGRDGMLAHSYMLGPNGQSNGCVSFDDYPAFLHAFLRGEVDRLVVVAHLPSPPSRALLSRRRDNDRYAANSY